MKTIRINRAEWLRGNKDPQGKGSQSYLWDIECNAGCCLGHFIHQTTKVPYNDLHQLLSPKDFFHGTSILTDYVFKLNTSTYLSDYNTIENNSFAKQAIIINDVNRYTEEQRETKLIELFAENNIKLEFYN